MKKSHRLTLTVTALLILYSSMLAEEYRHYFPLKVENNWQYRFEKTETIYALPDSIFGTVPFNNLTYYQWGDNGDFPIFIRQDEQGRIYRFLNMQESVWFDFSVEHGGQYRWSPDDQETFIVTVKKNLTVMTYAGQFTNCIEFFFDNQAVMDEEYSYVFAPNIGIVKKQFSRMSMLLVSAQVDRKYIARAVQTKANVISGFALSQNYPNPFNATTFIRFALPQESMVSLEIYDIRGAKVRTLVAARQSPGEYLALWDGADDAGRAVNSGIYTYRFVTDGFVEVKRMVLLR